MSNKMKPLERDTPVLSHIDTYGIYLHVPYRQKDSIWYRNLVKNIQGKYDSLRERWLIESVQLDPNTIHIINHYKIYDGKFFKYRRYTDDSIFDPMLDANHLELLRDKPIVCKEINYSKEHRVHFYTGVGCNFVIQAFYSNHANYTDPKTFIKEQLIYLNVLPTEIARDEYRHYAGRAKEDIVTLPSMYLDTAYHFWRDRYANNYK